MKYLIMPKENNSSILPLTPCAPQYYGNPTSLHVSGVYDRYCSLYSIKQQQREAAETHRRPLELRETKPHWMHILTHTDVSRCEIQHWSKCWTTCTSLPVVVEMCANAEALSHCSCCHCQGEDHQEHLKQRLSQCMQCFKVWWVKS